MSGNDQYEIPDPVRGPRGLGFAIVMLFCAFTIASAFVLWSLNFNAIFVIAFLLLTPAIMVIGLFLAFAFPGERPAQKCSGSERARTQAGRQ